MWLTVVDATKGEARFSMEPRRFRSKAYAEAAAKVARKIVESPLEVVPSP